MRTHPDAQVAQAAHKFRAPIAVATHAPVALDDVEADGELTNGVIHLFTIVRQAPRECVTIAGVSLGYVHKQTKTAGGTW